MKITKIWKPLISIVGIILIMMTVSSVSAEDPLVRETQYPDETDTTDSTNDTDYTTEPVLIATEDTKEQETNDLPDYENYTGDMLISPGPNANSEATTPVPLLIVGIIGAVAVIAIAILGLLMKRK